MDKHSIHEDSIPLSMLNAFVYCPRRFYLEHVEGVFLRNEHVEDGRLKHARVDDSTTAARSRKEGATIHTRSVHLDSPPLGVSGIIDLVEHKAGEIYPVEYKHGEPHRDNEGKIQPWENDAVQLCAQALLLEEELHRSIPQGFLYYMRTRERVAVPLNDELRQKTRDSISATRSLCVPGASAPIPLLDSPKCPACSLRPLCLPEEIALLRDAKEASSLPSSVRTPVRVLSPCDEGSVLYLQEQGGWVGKEAGHLVVHLHGADKVRVPMARLQQVVAFGNVQISMQAMESLLDMEIPVVFLSVYGRFKGALQPAPTRNVNLRVAQFRAFSDSATALKLAREVVRSKIINSRVLLMRSLRAHEDEEPIENESEAGAEDHAAIAMKNVLSLVDTASDFETLLGIEGSAARTYFENFHRLIRVGGDSGAFDFQTRNRRPPRDPVNALLSFAYALLCKDVFSVLAMVGFDPYYGFYHGVRRGQPSLALDLMEEFRAPIADSVILTLINKQMLTERDFLRFGGACYLNESGRKTFFGAYESRKAAEIIHPVFGYRVSYRRAIEVQARMLAALLRGDLKDYIGFKVR